MTSLQTLLDVYPELRALPAVCYTTEPIAGNALRRSKVMLLDCAFRECEAYRALDTSAQLAIVVAVERACYNEACAACAMAHVRPGWDSEPFRLRYHQIVLERADDLDVRENEWLAPRVIAGEIDAAAIGGMSALERAPQRDLALLARIAVRRSTRVCKKTTGAYMCPVCAQRECWVQQVQLRGLDEAKSTIVTCATCDHRWTAEL